MNHDHPFFGLNPCLRLDLDVFEGRTTFFGEFADLKVPLMWLPEDAFFFEAFPVVGQPRQGFLKIHELVHGLILPQQTQVPPHVEFGLHGLARDVVGLFGLSACVTTETRFDTNPRDTRF